VLKLVLWSYLTGELIRGWRLIHLAFTDSSDYFAEWVVKLICGSWNAERDNVVYWKTNGKINNDLQWNAWNAERFILVFKRKGYLFVRLIRNCLPLSLPRFIPPSLSRSLPFSPPLGIRSSWYSRAHNHNPGKSEKNLHLVQIPWGLVQILQ